jgi:hypothetical protein
MGIGHGHQAQHSHAQGPLAPHTGIANPDLDTRCHPDAGIPVEAGWLQRHQLGGVKALPDVLVFFLAEQAALAETDTADEGLAIGQHRFEVAPNGFGQICDLLSVKGGLVCGRRVVRL